MTKEITELFDTYTMFIVCNNCDHKTAHNISKGIRIENYVMNIKCKACGCNMV